MNTRESLKLALIHLRVEHKQPEDNRRRLVALAAEAAGQGAAMIVAPEMSISGYSFDSRRDIAPYAESATGPTLTALTAVAQKFGTYICVGLAERDGPTGILYNSAFVLGPSGNLVCRYRKINAESRWACPGDHRLDNTFATPWGRVGLLVCSDTYYGLMPRVTALRGADLLLVPSNWPPLGLDPRELWRARALENGLYLAACNRTGVDLIMDCRQASSCVFDPGGRILLDGAHDQSQIFWVTLPLTANHRLDGAARQQRLADRRPEHYHDCYLNLRLGHVRTGLQELPPPGVLNIHCLVPNEGEHPADALQRRLPPAGETAGHLLLLPSWAYADAALERIALSARHPEVGVFLRRPDSDGQHCYFFINNGATRHWRLPPWPFDGHIAMPCHDFGPLRFLVAPFPSLAHPELAVTAAKQGCDLALAPEEEFSTEHRWLAGPRTIENLALAVCSRNYAGIWIPPEGIHRWEEVAALAGDVCRYELDTSRLRHRKFQDRIDFEVLFRQPPGVAA